ncbi:MAG: isoprenyl transferase [Acutalibacteraceae bacterium]|nr:isoprenyl transferase [Acutalibacteraceae bacterium]
MALFKRKPKSEQPRLLPEHIAIIMDGNGRWAKNKSLPRTAGHAAGSKKFKEIARYCNKIGIKYLTVYAFSTENWRRPKEEVDAIMNIFRDYLKDSANFKNENIKLEFIGDRSGMPEDIAKLMAQAEFDSKDATGLKCYMAINYGGRDELVHAVRDIVKEGIPAEEITEDTISTHIYTSHYPDPELIIRPSGEYRLSNFLIWQAAYSEFWFSNVLWPDFTTDDLDRAIDDYNKRNRRFGGV